MATKIKKVFQAVALHFRFFDETANNKIEKNLQLMSQKLLS